MILLFSAKYQEGNCQESGDCEDALESGCCLSAALASVAVSLAFSVLGSGFGPLLFCHDSTLGAASATACLGGLGLSSRGSLNSGCGLNDGGSSALDGYFLVDVVSERVGIIDNICRRS